MMHQQNIWKSKNTFKEYKCAGIILDILVKYEQINFIYSRIGIIY